MSPNPARRPTAGADRSAVDYAWPAMVRPSYQIKLVYLDLNHWIGLAKAAVGHADGHHFASALAFLRRMVSEDRIILPLSATHYMEMAGIENYQWRRDIAGVMEELSGFKTLMGINVVLQLEVEAALDALLGTTPRDLPPVPLINFGVLRALGKQGGLRIRDESGRDVTQELARKHKDGEAAFMAKLAEKEWIGERMLLQGPSDAEVSALRADGWDPLIARSIAEERASEERAQAARLDDAQRFRRGRIRDVVSARFVLFRINDLLSRELSRRGLTTELFGDSPERIRRFVDGMPSADVYVSLVAASHRNPATRWTTTSIFDIDALVAAVPYCDIVVTEKHFGQMLQTTGVARRLGTEVVTSLNDLVTVLDRGARTCA